MALNEETAVAASAGVDEAIGKMENFYRAVTGTNPPPSEVPYSPIPVEKDPSRFVEQQIERLLSMLGPATETMAAWTPPISVWENEKELLVCFDLPGVGRRDVEVTVHDNLLTVTGQRPPTIPGDYRLRASERPLGAFVRRVLLPPALRRTDASNPVNAQMREGILEIRVAREGTQAEKPKAVPVN